MDKPWLNEYGSGAGVKDGKLVAFIGTTPNIGTTLTAFGTAVQLAARLSCRIGYLCLNLKSSKLHRYTGLDKQPPGLDSIRAEMRSCSLSPRRLGSSAAAVKGFANLEVLYGTVQREQAEFFQPEDIEHLLRTARASYDICIVDVNAYWDNAATIAAMLQADRHVVVTTPDLGHFQEDLNRGLKAIAPLFNLQPNGFWLAVTQYSEGGTGGIRLKDIGREADMELVISVAYDPAVRDWLNRGAIREYAAGNTAFMSAVLPLVKRLAEQFGESLQEQSVPEFTSRWRYMFRRGAVARFAGPNE